MESLHAAHSGLPYSRPATPGLHPSQIGFVGIGAMGYFMARNLANRRVIPGFAHAPLLVWNRSPERPQKLVKELGEERIRIVQSLEELVNSCDVIITNLANDAVVKSIFEQFAKTLEVRETFCFGMLYVNLLFSKHLLPGIRFSSKPALLVILRVSHELI